jgi:hypothetical protein
MLRKLLPLLALTGGLTVGGVTYTVLTPRPGVTRAQLLDAGVADICSPVLVTCQVRVAQACRALPDGGQRPLYGTVSTQAMLCPQNSLLLRWPKAGGANCFELTGPSDTACEVVPNGCADNPALCAEDPTGEQAVRVDVDRCACRNPAAGLCRYPNPDGGTALNVPLGVTWPAPFAGAGCVRKVCQELAGDQGSSWPAECP